MVIIIGHSRPPIHFYNFLFVNSPGVQRSMSALSPLIKRT